jgi:trans-aconitate 2-methyltransferase
MPREWDAETYDAIADPQFRWGSGVVDRLELDGAETMLDAGCGSGRVTARLAERLPRGHVVALDGSTSMLETARRRLAPFGNRIRFVLGDLMPPLSIDEPVDAVLSTATFHWVADHDALFANLAAVLRPGGRLAAQCGGAGNLASVVRVLEVLGADRFTGKVFATPEQTEERLRAAAFTDIACWVHTEPTPFETLGALETFLRTVVLGDHVKAMSGEKAATFTHEVASRLPRLELDYVRLNVDAVRAG